MNAKDFDNIVGARLNWCEKTLCAKGDEYARGEVPEVDDTLHEGSSTESWQTAVSEQDTRRREQAATSAQRRGAMDALASACGYTIPPLQDGDDDPVVHIVPDKTSRATLPSGCLGRLCGRGDDDEWRPCPEGAL